MVGAWSKLIPSSPRKYQFEPTSNMAGPWLAGIVSGGAVPSRSAADAGQAATVSPAQARNLRTFIGNSGIASAVAKENGGASGETEGEYLMIV